jgi:hypothetical protein
MKLNSKKTGQNKAGQNAIKKRRARANGEWIEAVTRRGRET